MLTEDIRDYVRQACEAKANILGPSFFGRHIVVVADCAVQLAQELKGDQEIVEIASYLHDISAALDPATLPRHPRASADLATTLLRERGYPDDCTGRVADAIASHVDPLQLNAGTVEAVCLSNADAVSRILQPAYWLYFAVAIRRLEFEEARVWLRSLVEREWSLMIPHAQRLCGAHYDTLMTLLT